MSTEATPPATGSAGAGQQADGTNTNTRSGSSRTGRSGQRPRRGRGNNGNRTPRPNEAGPRDAKFTGRCDDLKGEIYDCSSYNQVDGYTKTTQELAEYVGRTYSGDAKTTIETLVLPTFMYPEDPEDGASQTDRQKWQKRVDSMALRRTSRKCIP
jgi:hypothetical protein